MTVHGPRIVASAKYKLAAGYLRTARDRHVWRVATDGGRVEIGIAGSRAEASAAFRDAMLRLGRVED